MGAKKVEYNIYIEQNYSCSKNFVRTSKFSISFYKSKGLHKK